MNDKHRALYDAISGIDPEFIEETMKPQRKQHYLLRFAAAAAVLALLLTLPSLFSKDEKYVTAPGILTITAHAYEEEGKFTEIPLDYSSNPLNEYGYCPLVISCVPGHPISFHVPDGENVTLDISVNEGHLYDWTNDIVDGKWIIREGDNIRSQQCTLSEDMTLYWRNFYDDPESNTITYLIPAEGHENVEEIDPETGKKRIGICQGERIENIYIDIIVRSNDHITGYAVIHIKPANKPGFQSTLLTSVSFPQIDGEYQDIPEEYVQQQIQSVK